MATPPVKLQSVIPNDSSPPSKTLRVKKREGMKLPIQLPTKGSVEAIGYDLYAHLENERGMPDKLMLPQRTSRLVPTALTIVAPRGTAILILSRSGLAKERMIFVANAPGLIDPDYRGEIGILLYNGSWETQWITHGMRVGQMVLMPYHTLPMEEVTALEDTERGAGGFGSTGQ